MAEKVEDQIDRDKVAQMRQMLADQNKEAVQHRFGEAVTNSPEFNQAEQDLARVRAQQRKMRAVAAEERDFVEAPGQQGTGTVHNPTLMVSAQEKERMAAEQETQRVEAKRRAEVAEAARREQAEQESARQAEVEEVEADQQGLQEPEQQVVQDQVEHQEGVSGHEEVFGQEQDTREPTAAERAFSKAKATEERNRSQSRDGLSR